MFISLAVGVVLSCALVASIASVRPLSRPSRVQAVREYLSGRPSAYVQQPVFEADDVRPLVSALSKLGHDDLAVALMWALALKCHDPAELELALVSVVSLDAQTPGFQRSSHAGSCLFAQFAKPSSRRLTGGK